MKKIFLALGLLLLGLGLWVDNSFTLRPSRKIASVLEDGSDTKEAVRKGDLSQLQGNEFLKAFKYALIGSAHGIVEDNQMGFRFGNFLVTSSTGQKVLVCNEYPYLQLTFEAEGIAVSGEVPKLIVRGVCETAGENSFIEALKIPYQDILALPLGQKDYVPADPATHQRMSFEFRNVVEQWPHQWNLVGVKLYDASGRSLSLNGYEIISILGQPLMMEWGQ